MTANGTHSLMICGLEYSSYKILMWPFSITVAHMRRVRQTKVPRQLRTQHSSLLYASALCVGVVLYKIRLQQAKEDNHDNVVN